MSANGERIAVWGAKGHAQVVAECLRRLGRPVAAFVESPAAEGRESISGRPVLRDPDPSRAAARLLEMGIREVVLGFGQCRGRLQIGQMLCAAGLVLPAIVHPCSVVAADVRLGAGVFIGAGCIIDPGVSIGDYTIVNHRAVVCHDTCVGRAVHVCPGVTVPGLCRIGELVWVGAGSTLRDRIRIGDRVYIGCGSNVVRDLPPGVLAYGNPAKVAGCCDDVF